MSRVRSALLQISSSALLTLAASNLMAAALDQLADDGLYTWRVAAVADAPSWCCYQWTGGNPKLSACDLDGENTGFSAADDDLPAGEEMQIYVDIKAGEIRSLRTLSTNCPVSSRRDIQDLGLLEVAESLDWLKPKVLSGHNPGDDALAAVAVHRGKAALFAVLGNLQLSSGVREQALFWLVQSDSDRAYAYVDQLLAEKP